MPELGGFAEIAPYLTHPLVLAGFGLLLFFGLLRGLLKSGIVPTVSQAAGGRTLLQLLRYGFVIALVVIVLGFALAFFQTGRQTVDVDQIIRAFADSRAQAAEHESTLDSIQRLSELEDGDAFRNAVLALIRKEGEPGAPQGIDRAIELLRQGQTGPAERVLAELLDRKLEERTTASAEAAEAARHLGAIAYLDDTAKALDAYRLATELDPDEPWGWIYLGLLRQRIANLEGAEQAFRQALEAAEQAGRAREAAVAELLLGDVQVAQGNLAAGLQAYHKSLEAFEDLAARDPGNTQWQHDLGATHDRIGHVRVAQGHLAGALAAYQASHDILADLAARDPRSTKWQRDLSVSHSKIGDVRVAQGDLEGALAAYQARHAIAENLAARDPGNAEWQRDLSVSHNRIGEVRAAQGDLGGALAAHQASLTIAQDLAARDVINTEWQRDLSVSHEKIGDVRVAQGDLGGALAAHQASLAIHQHLAVRDPGNTVWQRDLSVSHNKIGDVGVAQGDLAGALAAYQASLEIAEDLAARDPANAEWQRDLGVSHHRIGDVRVAQGDLAGRAHGLSGEPQDSRGSGRP